MEPNPVLKKLGFADDDRVVIIHADDIGMCHASLSAYIDLMDFGLVSSAATMVPCPWFPATAAYCREHPNVDMGVHTTLTCEWDSYRWGPISTSDPASGLIDSEGYFWRSTREIQDHGDSEAARIELNTQVQRAIDSGINPTHIDTHMGAVVHAKYSTHYAALGSTFHIPVLAMRWDAETFKQARKTDDETAQHVEQQTRDMEAQGIPLVDHMGGMPLGGEKPLELAQQKFSELKPGITHFVIHPSKDTPELRAIAPDWHARVADYEWFRTEALRDFIRNQGIHVIGYRPLCELMRNL
ncbi:MAG: polysaccharide deacetylase family protein [Anaerolineae bacterium]|nr:polysaccharide deacetylase family protein [Anaerolineae bacterium]